MSDIHESGPAFPIIDHNQIYELGISKRDWFAGQALIAIVSKLPLHGVNHLANVTHISVDRDTEHEIVMDVARGAYRYADAMLSARSNRGEEDNG